MLTLALKQGQLCVSSKSACIPCKFSWVRKTSSVGFSVQIPLLSTSSNNRPFFAWNTCPLSMKAITRGGSGRGGFVWGGGGVCLGGWGGSLEHPKLKHLLNWLLQRKKKLYLKFECGMNANVVLLIVYFLMLLQSIA